MFQTLRKVIGYAALGAMLATVAVPAFASPQGKKSGKKGGKKKGSGKAGKKGGGGK